MPTKIEQMIGAARASIGTSFHHQGRLPGVGLDCIGLIVIALRAVGFTVDDRLDYGRRPDGQGLIAALREHDAVEVTDISAGCILVFRYDRQPQHVALATDDDSMIHSFAPAGKVVETTIGDYWKRRLVAIYEFPELMETP